MRTFFVALLQSVFLFFLITDNTNAQCVSGDCSQGEGVYKYPDGGKYKGAWKNNLQDGEGTYHYANGDKYKGMWKNNLQDGEGTYHYANGDKYKGAWKLGVKEGIGAFFYANGDKYEGEFANDKKWGTGTFTANNGNTYIGEWRNDKREGKGTATYFPFKSPYNKDFLLFDKYVGEWSNNKKEGTGTYTWAYGHEYIGEFRNDTREGYGSMRYSNGKKQTGHWKADAFLGIVQDSLAHLNKPKMPALLYISNLRFEDNNGSKSVNSGETCYIKFLLSNKGKGDAYKLEVKLREINGIIGLNLADWQQIPTLQAGAEMEIILPVEGGYSLVDGKANLQILVQEQNGFDADAMYLEVETQRLVAPALRLADYVFSTEQGGEMQLGVPINLKVGVQNTGLGDAKNVKVRFSFPENTFATDKTEFEIPVFRAGESKIFDLQFFTNKRYIGNQVSVIASVSEFWGKYGTEQTMSVALNQQLSASEKIVIESVKTQQLSLVPLSLQSEVDKNIPQSKQQKPHAIAVVIGNRDYKHTKNVDFALHDSRSIKNYLLSTLGYQEANILYYENTSLDEFNTLFGSKENPKGRLYDIVKAGESDVFIYYSGHGAPDVESKTGYFVPVGCQPDYVRHGGYSLETFYANISKIPAKSMLVVLDACFSGTELVKEASPIGINLKGRLLTNNGLVLASSTGTQLSNWYSEQQHGLFTYFFLKGIQNRNADADQNGKLSIEELYQFISDKTTGVPYHSRKLHGNSREQTPTLDGSGDTNQPFIIY
jgi:hypothetical protein